MRSSKVEVPTPDGVADAYLTGPDEDGRHPAVLLIIDAIGLRPRIEEMADRIASRGYTVLAPNVFYRAGRAPVLPLADFTDPDSRASFMQAVRPLMDELTPERIVSDGRAYLDYLADLAPGPAAITGYCMGGRLGWRIAAAYPQKFVALDESGTRQLVRRGIASGANCRIDTYRGAMRSSARWWRRCFSRS